VKAVNASLLHQMQGAGLPVPENILMAAIEPADSSMAHLLAKREYTTSPSLNLVNTCEATIIYTFHLWTHEFIEINLKLLWHLKHI